MTEDDKAVEAVAQAIFGEGSGWNGLPWDGSSDDSAMTGRDRDYWRELARTAIAAYKAHLEAEGKHIVPKELAPVLAWKDGT